MTKKEVALKIDEKRKEGYIVHPSLLTLYKEDEEIPDEYLREDSCLFWMKPELPKPYVMYLGEEGMKIMNDLFRQYTI